MLRQLCIQQFALVDSLEITFHAGMTVITGETGAGKSIILNALGLCLGQRSSNNVVENGVEKAQVSAQFELTHLPNAQNFLKEASLWQEDECVVRRIIHADGRSRCYINGHLVPLQQLKNLGSELMVLHSQHAQQQLLLASRQREQLDLFTDHPKLIEKVRHCFFEKKQLQQEVEGLQQANEDPSKDEWLRYQIEELEALAIQEGEVAHLTQQHKQASHLEELLQQCQQLLHRLHDSDQENCERQLTDSLSELKRMLAIDPTLVSLKETLEQALLLVQESTSSLQRYKDQLEYDPKTLHEMDQRLQALHDMARKHKVSAEQLIERQTELEKQLHEGDQKKERLKKAQEKMQKVSADYEQAAKNLSQSRSKSAKQLQQAVQTYLSKLAFSDQAQFVVKQTPIASPSQWGCDHIEFLVNLNPGQVLAPLNKVASGGELSRIHLAIQAIIAEREPTISLVFDEVDVGMGGETASVVGQMIKQISRHHQTLCITHLPQVAALADHHLQVTKYVSKGKTSVKLTHLDPHTRIQELGRMLGGRNITPECLAHAKKMVSLTSTT